MINTNDSYRYPIDESMSTTSRTRSSSRTRKPTVTSKETDMKIKRAENLPKPVQHRIATRSSQRTPVATIPDDNDNSFMSNVNLGFSQFVNSKKRSNSDKNKKATKRSKVTIYANENESPTSEIQDIEQIKLIYETADGHTNLTVAATKNAQILANRNLSNVHQTVITNTTYNLNDHNHIIEDTQNETLVIPDTIADNDTQHNDSSWDRDIDRLMQRLQQPPTCKTQTQIVETQIEEENLRAIYPTQIKNVDQRSTQVMKTITQSERSQQKQIQTTTTTIFQTNEIGIQTENNANSSSIHGCCQDVSICPCVLRYSKLERLFMEKMSRFINIVPTIPNVHEQIVVRENHQKRRVAQVHSRFRRFRIRRKIPNRTVLPSISNNESTSIEEISDETITEPDNQTKENVEIIQEHDEFLPSNTNINPEENIISTTITIEKNHQSINELSTIEKIDTIEIIEHPSTLLIETTINNTCSTARRLVLTASSLDENQKSQFRLFIARFGALTSSAVDSTTTHVIVNENSSLICPLTGKIIQGIARHLFIISHRWLNECLSQESIVDERPYEIRGDTSLGSDHGGMRRSRLTPSYLLDKYSICLRCSSNDCAPLQTIEQVQELVELCGAKLVRSFSEIKTIDKERQMILVLGINGFSGGDKKRKALLDACQQFNVRCVNIHWLLISIAKYDVQPFENYSIN